ncbi:MAG: hypothetical protein AB8I08_11600 [Sandaracinaceae bacterium]
MVGLAIGCGGGEGLDGGAGDAEVVDAGALVDAGPQPDAGSDAGAPVGEWQLPDGYFTPSRMPMTLVHPRAEMADWAYGRNAYPGLAWEIPIVVQGGAWPFRYEVREDGGATGLRIGETLVREEEDGFVVHRTDEAYGVLSWADPVAGRYDVVVRVTDQEGTVLDVPISLQVGAEGWLFVDSEAGDDVTGDGSIEAPFATLLAVHGGANDDRFAGHRVVLAGTVALDGNVEMNGNLRLDPGAVPSVYVGHPDSGAVLESALGKIVVLTPDFYLGNLTYRHRADYVRDEGDPVHLLLVGAPATRFTIHDVTFDRFQGQPVNMGLGNSSVMMFTRGAERPHVAVVNCDIRGPSGVFTSAYSLRHAVFEHNRWQDAELSLADGSVPAVIYIKGDNESVTIRANEMLQDNVWSGLSGIGVNEGRLVEVAHNRVRTPYDTGRSGSIQLFTNSMLPDFAWTAETPVWVDRNSLREQLVWEGERLINMPDGTVEIARNLVSADAIPTSSRIVPVDNRSGGGLLDAQLEVSAEARDESLGRHGATVAAPVR